jgi:hypothetical protein
VTLSGPPESTTPARRSATNAVADVVRVDLAVDVRLAQPARDQLRVLRAEVEYQDAACAVADWKLYDCTSGRGGPAAALQAA